MIQWTNNGVDQFATPAKVLGLSNDGDWAFTDQSATGVPISEITVMQNITDTVVTPPAGPPIVPPHLMQNPAPTAPDAPLEGSVVLSSGKVKDVSFEVRVTGEVNKKVIERIRAILDMAKDDYDE